MAGLGRAESSIKEPTQTPIMCYVIRGSAGSNRLVFTAVACVSTPRPNRTAHVQRDLTTPELRENGSDLEAEGRRSLNAMTGVDQVRKEFRRERQDGEIPGIDDERPLTESLRLPFAGRDESQRAIAAGGPAVCAATT